MFDTHRHLPPSTAIAGETAVRVGGSLRLIGVSATAHRAASFPIYRGKLR